jgi:hypothetical protein
MVAHRVDECTSMRAAVTYVPPKVVFDLGFPYNQLLRTSKEVCGYCSLRLFWIDLRPTSPAEQKGSERYAKYGDPA